MKNPEQCIHRNVVLQVEIDRFPTFVAKIHAGRANVALRGLEASLKSCVVFIKDRSEKMAELGPLQRPFFQ